MPPHADWRTGTLPWIGMFTGVNGPGWPAAGLAAKVYFGEACFGEARCGVVDQDSLRERCDAEAVVCVHLLVGPEGFRRPSRSALCEVHSLAARGLAPTHLIERMHTI